MSLVGFSMLTLGPLVEPATALALRATNWRDVACPRCGAAIGLTCSSPCGHRGRPHRERIKLADGGAL